MAKRRSYSKSKKIEPSVQKLWFLVPNWDGVNSADAFHHIDLSQCVSLANRRFYRQGINWAVADMTFHVVNQYGAQYVKPGQFVNVAKLPNTWVMSNAWEKSFRAWQRMIKNATDEAGTQSIKGKFLDFKIYADSRHHSKGFANNLLPIGHTVGQWQPSEIEVPNLNNTAQSTAWELIAVGPSNPGAGASGLDAKSMIAGYAVSRALPAQEDPNVPADASNVGQNWMMSLFTDGTEQDPDVTAMLEVTGDNPPYPFEGDKAGTADTMYPGGENNAPGLEPHARWATPLTSVGTRFPLGGGNFPCGLIQFQNNVTLYSSDDFSGDPLENTYSLLEITLVPGTHRGYLCEPMTEM